MPHRLFGARARLAPEDEVSTRTGAASRLAPFVVVVATVGALAFAGGGYFPTAWGWSALALLWLVGYVLVTRSRFCVAGAEAVMLAGLAALVLWIGLSAAWSPSISRSIVELERALVYLAAVAALLLLARRRSFPHVVLGVLAGTTLVSAYALAGRLFPELLAAPEARLSAPLGYWNALAIVAAIGALVAVAVASEAERLAVRALAGGSLVVLVVTLYFTFSRGGWLALAAGLVATFAVGPRRLRAISLTLALAPAPVLAVAMASRLPAPSEDAAAAARPEHGHRLALAILLLTVLSGLTPLALAYLEARVAVPRGVRLAYSGALALAAGLALIGLFVSKGSPPALLAEASDAFSARLEERGDLKARLFTASGNSRSAYWRVALDGYAAHPWLGSGSGSYEHVWLQSRPSPSKVRDAHSLYLETLAELGPVGLAFLLVALATPLVQGVRARRERLVAGAFGAYVAYLLHAGLDWDWEIPAVTVLGLFCGVALLLARRPRARPAPLAPPLRLAAVALTFALAAFAFVGLLGNAALSASREAASSRNSEEARSEARKAMRFLPWSPEPWALIGEAHLAEGETAAARSSFRAAIEMEPGDWRLWLALAHASEGRARERALARAEALNPRSREIAAFRREAGR